METLQALLARLEIPDNWNVLLVGDGSGSKWGLPVGWGCVLLERDSFERRLFMGGMNDGTINLAEPLAYLAPLLWYMNKTVADRRDSRDVIVRHIHIVTDSEYVRSRGSSEAAVTSPANMVMWAAFELINRQGFRLHWHWVPRDTVELNRYVDAVSKVCRARFLPTDGTKLAAAIQERSGFCIATANPWE